MEDVVKVNSAQEFFDIMDGVTAKREFYPNVIKEYLQTKDRKTCYMVEYIDPVQFDEPVKMLKCLADEDVAEIEALVDAYIEKEYPEEIANGGKEDKAWRKDIMSEVAQANDNFMDVNCLYAENIMSCQMGVENIDLYEKYYCYEAKIATFSDGMNNPPEITTTILNLPDDVYIYLTTEFMINPDLTFNHLRTKNEEVYGRICRMIDNQFYDSYIFHRIPTYAVELTEVMEDAKACLEILERKNSETQG